MFQYNKKSLFLLHYVEILLELKWQTLQNRRAFYKGQMHTNYSTALKFVREFVRRSAWITAPSYNRQVSNLQFSARRVVYHNHYNRLNGTVKAEWEYMYDSIHKLQSTFDSVSYFIAYLRTTNVKTWL